MKEEERFQVPGSAKKKPPGFSHLLGYSPLPGLGSNEWSRDLRSKSASARPVRFHFNVLWLADASEKKAPARNAPPSPQNAMLIFQFPMFVRKVASETICLEGIGPSNFAKWGGGGGGFYFALTGLRRFCLSSSNHFPDVAQASACRSLSAVLHSRSCLVRRIRALHGSTSVPQ